ncbi:pathogeneis-related thaumatin-like protein 3.5 [Capsicum annuum]|uniref:pathogenesis-related thaumatin-like protein 3.5 n=1 Tax=Capsicum annuum TaxID=4072 RepID=UPI001FB142B4|nr:pathogenesis-related thaumatin-like protein 3.5 [Capsicum annuum]
MEPHFRLVLILLFLFFIWVSGDAAIITLKNKCNVTIWPEILSGVGHPPPMNGGLQLKPNETAKIKAPTGWSGRFWARTQCNFDKSGKGTCATGDCGGVLKCNGAGGTPPASLVEITLDSSLDFYDVNFVDGFNIPISVYPSGGHENCSHVKCSADINLKCPKELQVKSSDGKVIACKKACLAFNKPEYCCTEEFNNPNKCKPTKYSQYFKKACPNAYSYVYDDATSAFTCKGANYLITFC